MPHTLTDSADLSGSGEWATTGDAGDYLYITVTARGTLVVDMDPTSPPRIFQAGWLAVGHTLPTPDSPTYYQTPIWIEFDHMIVNLFGFDHITVGDSGYTAFRYELIAGTKIHVDVYQFT